MSEPVLVRDEARWAFRGPDGQAIARRLRVWHTGPDEVVAVVTEHLDDEGTSVTNAAEQLVRALRDEYETQTRIRVLEHYPGDPSFVGEVPTFSEVVLLEGQPVWHDLPADDVVAWLGPSVLDALPQARPPAAPQPIEPPALESPIADETVFHGYPHGPGGPVVLIDSPSGEALGVLEPVVAHREFGWGHLGGGPAELAQALLVAVADPAALCPACAGTAVVAFDPGWGVAEPWNPDRHSPAIALRCHCSAGLRWPPIPLAQQFRDEVVSRWPRDAEWTITAADVRTWLAQTGHAPGT